MSKTLLALDIRANALSAVLLKSGMKSNVVDAHLYVPFAESNDTSERPDGLEGALTSIAEQLDLTDALCVVAYPSERISYRNIRVPFKDPRKIKQVLPFELEPSLAQPVEELVLDFAVIKKGEATDLLTAALEKELLDDLLATLEKFGLKPVMVSAGTHPTAYCLTQMSEIAANAVIIDSDATHHILSVIADGQVSLIRPFPKGRTPQSDIQTLVLNIQRTLTVFEELDRQGFKAQGIYLTGYGIDAPAAETKIANLLNLPTQRVDRVSDSLDFAPEYDDPDWNPYLMQNALALAAIELDGQDCLNFHRTRTAITKHWGEHKRSFITSGCLLALVLILLIGSYLFELRSRDRDLNELNQQIERIFKDTFPEVKRIVDPLQQMRNKIAEKKKEFSGAAEESADARAIDILRAVSQAIPANIDVELNRFAIGSDSVTISGDTANFNAVDDMKSRLEQQDLFKTVTISSANMEKNSKRVRFKLKIDL
jgi:type II secretion system protein L